MKGWLNHTGREDRREDPGLSGFEFETLWGCGNIRHGYSEISGVNLSSIVVVVEHLNM